MNTSIFMCKKCSKPHEKVLNINSTSSSELNNIQYSNSIYDSNIQDYYNINDLAVIKTINNLTESNKEFNDELQIIDYPYNNQNETSSLCSKTTIKKYSIDEKFNNSEKNTPCQISHPAKNIFNLFNYNNSQIIGNKKKINNLLINNDKGRPQNKLTSYNCYFLKKKSKNKLQKLNSKINSNKFISQIQKNNINNKNKNNSHLFEKNLISKNKDISRASYNKYTIKNCHYDSNQRSHKTINGYLNKNNYSINQKKENLNKNKKSTYTIVSLSKKNLILNKNINKKYVNNLYASKDELKLTDSAGNIKNVNKKKALLMKSKSTKIILPDTTYSSQMRKCKNIINIKSQKQLF